KTEQIPIYKLKQIIKGIYRLEQEIVIYTRDLKLNQIRPKLKEKQFREKKIIPILTEHIKHHLQKTENENFKLYPLTPTLRGTLPSMCE
ncbi:hypothetical protein VIGAN_08289400, partial [Vigna angularis var. angularis]